ncbi:MULTISPECIES: hypothetical protein [unclassified Novosphingobium]|uniref:hypothetical protein n=2 Tax=Novosphingobium TaxID=165696 RepID=UPI000D302B06|nr:MULTISPECIES: hypothetical protein [unclassified Novosphingobium]PTR05063.1 hypothetical protein C8K11_1472 [Novosphingobium sp. GV055]PUB10429.1 hypothetical protein C8K14_1442 [Novosphingobium sp. GV079]
MTWAEQEFRVWHGIQSPEPPAAAFDYAEIREMAERMLDTRRNRFPHLVAKGRMTAAEAEAQIAVFETLAAEWRWMATGEGAPAEAEQIPALREALDQSIATIAEIAREQRGLTAELAAQAEWVIAMAWHLEPGRRTRACRAQTFVLRQLMAAEKEARRAA